MTAVAAMCRECGAENSALALLCTGCGAYLRDRVAALDLFSTLWGVIEDPAATFLRIARSEQKNYTHLLFAAAGPVLFAFALSIASAGDAGLSFVELLALVVLAGPVFGLLIGVLATMLLRIVMKSFAFSRLRYRDISSSLAWALSPLGCMSVLIVPLQLGLFGITMFSRNPAAWELQPVPYWLLAGIEAAAVLWTLLLLSRCMLPHGEATPFRVLPPLLLSTMTAIVLTGAALILIT